MPNIKTRSRKHAVHKKSTPLMRRMILSLRARRSGSHLGVLSPVAVGQSAVDIVHTLA